MKKYFCDRCGNPIEEGYCATRVVFPGEPYGTILDLCKEHREELKSFLLPLRRNHDSNDLPGVL